MPNRMHSTDSDTEFACITKKVRRSISAWNQSSETFETHFSYVWRALHVKQEFTCSPVESHVTKCKILMNGGGTLAAFSVSTAQSLDTDSEHSTKHTPPDWLLSQRANTWTFCLLSQRANTCPPSQRATTWTFCLPSCLPSQWATTWTTLSRSNHLNVSPTQPPAYGSNRQCYLKTSKLRILKRPLSSVRYKGAQCFRYGRHKRKLETVQICPDQTNFFNEIDQLTTEKQKVTTLTQK